MRAKRRYEVGLDKLAFAASQVNTMIMTRTRIRTRINTMTTTKTMIAITTMKL